MPFDWDRIGLGRQSSLGRTFHGEPVGLMTDINAVRNAWGQHRQERQAARAAQPRREAEAPRQRRERQRPDQISAMGMEGANGMSALSDWLGRNTYGRYANRAVDQGIYGGAGPFNSGGYGAVPNILAPNTVNGGIGGLQMNSPWKQSGVYFNDRQQQV